MNQNDNQKSCCWPLIKEITRRIKKMNEEKKERNLKDKNLREKPLTSSQNIIIRISTRNQ